MLQDYELKSVKSKFEKCLPYIELLVAVIIIQALILLFTGAEEEEGTIRFRLLAHSNAQIDQRVKMDIQDEIEPLIKKAMKDSSTKEQLGDNLKAIEPEIISAAKEIAGSKNIKLERKNALIPPKRSGLFIHPQSFYDAYILTIGSGRGDNWWCAVFPDVCFGDKEAVEVDREEEEVTFFLWEWIKGIF